VSGVMGQPRQQRLAAGVAGPPQNRPCQPDGREVDGLGVPAWRSQLAVRVQLLGPQPHQGELHDAWETRVAEAPCVRSAWLRGSSLGAPACPHAQALQLPTAPMRCMASPPHTCLAAARGRRDHHRGVRLKHSVEALGLDEVEEPGGVAQGAREQQRRRLRGSTTGSVQGRRRAWGPCMRAWPCACDPPRCMRQALHGLAVGGGDTRT
jgi:hypothetical protein